MKTHSFDTISFISGVVITALGVLFLIPRDVTDLFALIGDLGNWSSWFWAVVFLAIGAVVLAPLVRRRQSASEEFETTTEPGRSVL